MMVEQLNTNFFKSKINSSLIQGQEIKFGYQNRQVFFSLNFQIFTKSLTLITGINGGGKTTLLKLIAGALIPKAGTITRKWEDYQKQQAYQPAFNLLDTGLTLDQHTQQLAKVDGFSVEDFQSNYKALSTLAEPNQKLKTLSTGTLRKLNLAAILALHGRDLIFIDELDELLDEESLSRLADLLAQKIGGGKTIVATLQHTYWLEGISCSYQRITLAQNQPVHV